MRLMRHRLVADDYAVGAAVIFHGCKRVADSVEHGAATEPDALATGLHGAVQLYAPDYQANKWQQMVNRLMSQATYIDVPYEETICGSVQEHLFSYCTSHIRAMAPEEIEMGKPWTDDGVTKFKMEGLSGVSAPPQVCGSDPSTDHSDDTGHGWGQWQSRHITKEAGREPRYDVGGFLHLKMTR